MNRQLNILLTISFVLIVAVFCLVGSAFPTAAQDSSPVILTSTPQIDTQPAAKPDLTGDQGTFSRPLPTPISPITSTAELIISDQYFLTGHPWDAAELQQTLDVLDSVLAVAYIDPYKDGVAIPASEAMASVSAHLTVSPPVLLTLAEMEFGLLSRTLADSEPLAEEELVAFADWYHQQAAELSERYYQIDDLAGSASADTPDREWDSADTALLTRGLNSASYAVSKQLASGLDANDPSGETTQARIDLFIDTYTRYFGSPLSGNLKVSDPKANSPGSPESTKATTQAMPLLYFPWTGTDQWNFTGGPHGTNLAAVDFQPTGWGGKKCNPMYVPDKWITAMAGGKVITSSGYQVIIDHDYDGKSDTGWQTKYFHVYNIKVSNGQTVSKNTVLGNPSCYGGDATGVHGHFETRFQGKAQAAHGKVIGGWTVEKGSAAYAGTLKKGKLVRQAGVANKMVLVSNNCSPNTYYAEFYNSLALDDSIYPPTRYYCDSVISYEWGGGSPGSPVSADNFIVRWEGEFTGFSNSDYTFVARADDGIRVYLDNRLIINKWIDQGPTAYYSRQKPAAGSHHVKVEYYERGGGATARVGWCHANYYIVDYYNNRNMSGRPAAYGCQSAVNNNWGSNKPVSGVNADNFSARWMGLFNFTNANHHFFANGDDGIRVYVDNSRIIDAWKDQAPTEYRATRSMSSGLHSVMVEYYEAAGGAVAAVWWSPNWALNRHATATSVQNSSSYSASKGNDGNNSTRWSSSVPSTLIKDQWWIVDLGSRRTFSQFRINWENAYAKEYYVAWKDGSDCNGTFTGFKFTTNRSGWVTHGTGIRTARCIAVVMVKRGPYGNYSFWETELFSPTFNARNGRDGLAIEELPDSVLFYSGDSEFLLLGQPPEFQPFFVASDVPSGELVELEFNMNDMESVQKE